MALTYTIRGGDGKEYGPATLEQLHNWIKEGRVHAQAEVRRSDMDGWAAAGAYQELQSVLGSGGIASAPALAASQSTPTAVPQLRSSASWFYWIAGLSLINSIAAFAGTSWRFILGLGVTQIFDALASHVATGGKIIALALDLLAAGLFVLFGFLAQKGYSWPFLVGMLLFALDGLLFVAVQDWLGIGFHVLVLYWLFRGFKASRLLGPVKQMR